MKYGSLHPSINLPSDSDDSFSPDGLSETDIDALLVEAGCEVELDEIDEHEAAPVVPLRDDTATPTTEPTGGQAA